MRAQLRLGFDGRLHASVLPLQQPFRIQPFADADAWVVLPEDAGDCVQGGMVEIASLQPGAALSMMQTITETPHEIAD
jgi:molybdopterin molybdotransferase